MKRVKKLTAGILAMIMAVSASVASGSVASAEETNPPAATDGLGLDDISQQGDDAKDVSYLQDTIISPVFVETSEQASDYSETMIDIPAGDQTVTQLYPVTIPQKGAVTFMVAMVVKNNMETMAAEFSQLKAELYSDVACTDQCGTLTYFSNEMIKEREIFCPSAGTYYLKIEVDRANGVTDELSFVLGSFFVSNEDRNLEENVFSIAYADQDNKDIYYKLQVRKTDVVVLQAFPSDYTSALGGNITLCDAKKKAVSAKEYISNTKDTSDGVKYARAYYTVKKGTYYIKLSMVPSTSHYIVGYSLANSKDASGASKAKAAKLTIGGKAKQGMVLVSDSTKKTDWYKLTLTKEKKFTINVNAYVAGKLKMEVCNSKGQVVMFGKKIFSQTGSYKMSTTGKWKEGTYYIKITKGDKKSSGYYEIKIK